MLSDPAFLVFCTATLAMAVSPGPAAICMAAQGSANGWQRAGAGTLGILVANLVFFVLSATGIAVLLLASHLVFSVIKWCGVAYLLYLSVKFLTARGGFRYEPGRVAPLRSLFTQGLVVQLSNPKALLYFTAILPQFVQPGEAVAMQVLWLGVAKALIDLVVYTAYSAFGQGVARSGLRASTVRAVNSFAGGALLFAAWKMAFTSAKRA